MPRIPLSLLGLLLLAGCAVQSYGSDRGRLIATQYQPTASTALLARETGRVTLGLSYSTPHIEVLEVDGQQLSVPLEADILLAPGRHQATLMRMGFPARIIARGPVEFLAEAGRSYVPNAVTIGERTWFWIEDEKTGAVVGGHKPMRAA